MRGRRNSADDATHRRSARADAPTRRIDRRLSASTATNRKYANQGASPPPSVCAGTEARRPACEIRSLSVRAPRGHQLDDLDGRRSSPAAAVWRVLAARSPMNSSNVGSSRSRPQCCRDLERRCRAVPDGIDGSECARPARCANAPHPNGERCQQRGRRTPRAAARRPARRDGHASVWMKS